MVGIAHQHGFAVDDGGAAMGRRSRHRAAIRDEAAFELDVPDLLGAMIVRRAKFSGTTEGVSFDRRYIGPRRGRGAQSGADA